MVLPISGNSAPNNTQQLFERPREEQEQELSVEQPNTVNNTEDRLTTAAPIEESSASARTENRTDNQDINNQQDSTSADETVGSQLDIRA